MPRRRARRRVAVGSPNLIAGVRATIRPHQPPARATALDVPPYAWANFFLGALHRLERVDRYAAEETALEFLQFFGGWLQHYHRQPLAVQAEWMARNFTAVGERSLRRRGPRTSMATSPRFVLFLQNQLAKGLIPTQPEALRLHAAAAREAATAMQRRLKRRGIAFDADAMLRTAETARQQTIERAKAVERRKLSYQRGLLPFEDALNRVDPPRRGGRPPK